MIISTREDLKDPNIKAVFEKELTRRQSREKLQRVGHQRVTYS